MWVAQEFPKKWVLSNVVWENWTELNDGKCALQDDDQTFAEIIIDFSMWTE